MRKPRMRGSVTMGLRRWIQTPTPLSDLPRRSPESVVERVADSPPETTLADGLAVACWAESWPLWVPVAALVPWLGLSGAAKRKKSPEPIAPVGAGAGTAGCCGEMGEVVGEGAGAGAGAGAWAAVGNRPSKMRNRP